MRLAERSSYKIKQAFPYKVTDYSSSFLVRYLALVSGAVKTFSERNHRDETTNLFAKRPETRHSNSMPTDSQLFSIDLTFI